jgi:hypothetical protein
MKKTIYRTIVTIEVLSPEPDIHTSLTDIADEMDNGEYSGAVSFGKPKPIKGKVAARTILAQGSDPEFFGMDERGNELED